jgi:hypothetical protein
MLLVTDITPAVYALDKALCLPHAEVRGATDLAKDPWGQFIEVLTKASAQKLNAPALTTAEKSGAETPRAGDLGPPLAGMNPWLVDTMTIIDAGRKSFAGGQQEKAVLPLLTSAEMLASFITEIGAGRRPQLNIEPSGRPTFATATDDFYIHLTVDAPNRLTWYAVAGGAEHFDEGVAFDGRRLPPALAHLFTL